MKRAREILASIESDTPVRERHASASESEPDLFTAFTASRDSEAAEKIREADINTMTPIEAINLLFELKRMLGE